VGLVVADALSGTVLATKGLWLVVEEAVHRSSRSGHGAGC